MHKQLPSWQLIQQSLQQGIAVMLLYVLESKGSSPGRQGFMMAINADGAMSGSMGGGIMEHKFVELAKAKLLQHAEEHAILRQVHDKRAAKNQSGMICSGEQTIFLHTVTQRDGIAVDAIITSLQQHENGTLRLSMSGIQFTGAVPDFDYYLQRLNENEFIYQEKTGYKNILHIIGAGHCALALSRLMSVMDFYIHLYDDRRELNTMEANHFVHRKHLLADYTELTRLINGTANSYVLIMTVGYRTDAIAINALQDKSFAYTGVLGSSSKMSQLLSQLREEGTNARWLDSLYTPVGIPIKSQTTEEIAVSIAAQIIQVKNNRS